MRTTSVHMHRETSCGRVVLCTVMRGGIPFANEGHHVSSYGHGTSIVPRLAKPVEITLQRLQLFQHGAPNTSRKHQPIRRQYTEIKRGGDKVFAEREFQTQTRYCPGRLSTMRPLAALLSHATVPTPPPLPRLLFSICPPAVLLSPPLPPTTPTPPIMCLLPAPLAPPLSATRVTPNTPSARRVPRRV